MTLDTVIASLAKMHGPAPAPPSTDPFELVLWENVAYLLDDVKRGVAFEALRARIGLAPERILAANDAALQCVAALGGMRPVERVARLREIARLAIDAGDLREVARRPLKEALKELKKFPSLGTPGAEKVLLFSGYHAVPALESNGLRVLLRLGFGAEDRSYDKSYRSVRDALGSVKHDAAWLTAAHLQLRRHGQEICKRTAPGCEVCVLRATCAYVRAGPPAPRAARR